MITGKYSLHSAVFPLLASVSLLVLTGCEDGSFQNPFQAKPANDAAMPAMAATGEVTERDVEAPEVFSVSEAGLWDGRPSLGGVWVAHPDVEDAGRVIIRNTKNDKFVIGALFRRERANPGPALQISSDAAEALEILAGSPTTVSVIALRREEVAVSAPAPMEQTTADQVPDAPEIEATALDPIAQSASAAIAAAEATPAPTPKPVVAAPKAPAPKASSLSKPFIQIGIFSIEANANNTATSMRQIGVVPTVRKQTSKGKTFWRVIVGPATNSTERAGLLKKIKAQGFEDAYFVTN